MLQLLVMKVTLLLLFIFIVTNGTAKETQNSYDTHFDENGLKENQNRDQNPSEALRLDLEKSDVSEGNVDKETCFKANLWSVWDSETKLCHCGDDLGGVVQCSVLTKELSVIDCHCLTVHFTAHGTTLPVVGSCIYNCANHTWYNDIMYHSAPSDCASLNRQGTLCGQCLDGYTVPAYSYEFKCIRCDSQLENWGLYIVFAFLPLTIFTVIILVFRINVLSPKLNMFVFAAQNVSIPMFLRIVLYILSQGRNVYYVILAKVLLALYGFWNLDFFRSNVLPDVCVNAIPLHILVLDYLIAIYPMLLMAVAYTIVELYHFGFRPFMYVWKPFHYFFARFRRQWGIQNTIMDAFVTFFFLSSTKLLSVSCSLLIGVPVYSSDGKLYMFSLYYDPSIEYFGKEHLPYALLAIGILTIFIVFPTSLLLCYPCKPFLKCRRKCQVRNGLLDEFVNTFQKYYKDGTNGTFDCRWFAGFFILTRSLAYSVYAVSLSDVSHILIGILCIVAATIIVMVEPYKEEYKIFNVVSAILFLWEALFFTTTVYKSAAYILQPELGDRFASVIVLALVPLVYIIVVVLHHLIRRFRGQKGGDGLTSSLPHRLLHSDQYRDSFGYIATSSHYTEQ